MQDKGTMVLGTSFIFADLFHMFWQAQPCKLEMIGGKVEAKVELTI
jgi:hypothetical protein